MMCRGGGIGGCWAIFSLVAVVMGVVLRPRLLSSRSTLFLSSHVFSSVLSLLAGSPCPDFALSVYHTSPTA